MLSTNHHGSCIAFCTECSWKPSWRKDPSLYGDTTLSIAFNGRTYRPFDYVGEIDAAS